MRIGMYDPGHVAEWLRLMNLVRPVPINLPEFEAREAVWRRSDLRLRYLGCDGSRAVAIAQVAVSPYAPADHLAAVVVVDPGHLGRGLGSTMLAVLENEAEARGFRGLVGTVAEDAHALQAWLEARGFRRFSLRFDSVLDLDRVDARCHARGLKRVLQAGVTYTDMEDATETDWQELISMFQVLLLETPDMQGLPAWAEDRCRSVLRDNPNARPDWIIVARYEGKAIGMTVGHRMGEEIYAFFTGVLRRWRGQGIGLALKLEMMEAARSQGVARMRTTNLDSNTPILRVNAALGFKRALGTLEYRKALAQAQL